MRQEGGLPGTRVPRNARSVLGDHSFGSNDADFVLFGVMTEEIHWLQSGVVVPRVTPPSLRRRRHLRRCANVVHELAIVEPRFCRLCARCPVDLHGDQPSLVGSCAGRVGDVPCCPRCHLRCFWTARRGRVPIVLRVRQSSPLLFHRKSSGGS